MHNLSDHEVCGMGNETKGLNSMSNGTSQYNRYSRAYDFLNAIENHPPTDASGLSGLKVQLAEMQVKIDEMEQKVAAEKAAEAGPFVPKTGEIYFGIDIGTRLKPSGPKNNIQQHITDNDTLLGGVYRTKEDAQVAIDRMIAIGEVNAIIREENARAGWVADWSDRNTRVANLCYNHQSKDVQRNYNSTPAQPLVELDYFHTGAFNTIKARITQYQINKLWRL